MNFLANRVRKRSAVFAHFEMIIHGTSVWVPLSIRLATENSSFFVPEATLGLGLAGGLSHALPRLLGGNQSLALCLALTGMALEGPDLFFTQIATGFMTRRRLDMTMERLAEVRARRVACFTRSVASPPTVPMACRWRTHNGKCPELLNVLGGLVRTFAVSYLYRTHFDRTALTLVVYRAMAFPPSDQPGSEAIRRQNS